MEILLFGFILCGTNLIHVEAVPTVEAIKSLSRTLLANYSRHILPNSDYNNQFVINIEAYPLAVGDLDEIEERLATVLGFKMTWNDASIKWNTADHNNITNITLGLNDVWRPTLMLFNPHQNYLKGHSEVSPAGISFYYLGTTRWTSMLTVHTTCDLETTYFPFDVQECDILFYVSGNDGYDINVNASWAERYPYAKENGAWKIVDQEIKGYNSSGLSIHFKFERKPMFVLINILMPMVILAMLTPLVFLLPKNSGERLGYSVTLMLAISVYMTIVSDYLPKNSDPMPLISYLIFVSYILNATIVFIVIMNVKIRRFKERRRIPGCVCTFVRLTRAISQRKTLTCNGYEEETEDCLTIDNEEENVKDVKTKSVRITWIEVSVAIDGWCFVLIYLIKIILLIATYAGSW